MGNPVAFFEIISPDATRARSFYTELVEGEAGIADDEDHASRAG